MPTTKQRINRQTLELWVKATELKKATGWSNEMMRKARRFGWITWKKENGFFYDLHSIPQELVTKEKKQGP